MSIPSLGLVDVNESACRQLNYSRHELLSLSFADLVPAETVAAINLLIAAKGGEKRDREILTTTLSKSGGGDLPVEVTIRLVTFDTECYGVAVARDITERRRAEEALRQQFSQLADIIDFLPDATFVIDAEGKIIIWNRAAEEFTGVKAEEMLGKGNREYSIPFYGERRPVLIDLVFAPSPETEKLYPQVERDGVMVIGESLTRSKRGEAYMLGIAAPLYDSDGNIVGAIESVRDITDRKKAENALRESERKFHAIFDQTFQFTGLMALDGTLMEANRAALEFIGAEGKDVIGKPFWATPWWTHSPELQDTLRTAVKKAAEGEFVRFEATHQAYDGEIHYIDFSIKPVRDDAGMVVLLIPEGRDISERKEMEQLKDDMISSVSHEMRTPLTAMMGYTELLLEDEMVPLQQKDYLRIIYKESERLHELIENFLSLQRFKSRWQKPQYSQVAILPLVEEVAGVFAGRSPLHRVTIHSEENLPAVLGNPDRLRQVLNNLVSNAVKFSPKGGEVYIDVRGEDGSVIIMVRDEGIGIRQQELERVFNRLYQVDSTSLRAFGGTGLGLALVREIVAAHGGRVWAESTFGKGSSFFVFTASDR